MIVRSILQSTLLTSLFLVAIIWQSATASADVVIFTHSGLNASGTLDGNSFSNTNFTITSVGNTDNLTSSVANQLDILHDSASIELEGIGVFDFTTATRTIYIDNADTVGLNKPPTNGGDVYLSDSNAAFDGWDMLSSLGPVSGQHTLVGWDFIVVNTTGGRLVFNDETIAGSFQASVVPEPASSALLGIGAVFGILVRSRRRRQVS